LSRAAIELGGDGVEGRLVELAEMMLGSWGYSRSRSTTAVLVSGVWNSFIKLAMPVLALALVLLQGGAGGGWVAAAVVGIAGLVTAIVIFALLLGSADQARRFGLLAGRVATRLRRLIRRGPVTGWELATVKFRNPQHRPGRPPVDLDHGDLAGQPPVAVCGAAGGPARCRSATPRWAGPRSWPCSPSPGWSPPSRSPRVGPGWSRRP
jgi:hypothetical protein